MTKLQEVARAIGNSLYGYCDQKDTPNTWAVVLGAAADAIAALRDPSEAMVEAAFYAMGDHAGQPEAMRAALRDLVRVQWRVMIATLLAEAAPSEESEG